MIGRTVGPYRILDSLGEGGMGEVYRAHDTRLDRTVAIKILPAHVANDPVRRERFDREARTIATLTHPHICALYDVGHQDGVDFLVLEHLEGETLESLLRAGPLPSEQALRYGIELTDALDQAHRRGIVHRDLKPANIIVTSTGVKLLDFGLAQLRQRDALSFERGGQGETTSLTAEGTILGTLQYMAPEQIEGRGNDHRADLFALGAVLYEMATGEKAFSGNSPAGQMAAVLTSEPPPVSTVRPEGGFPRAFDHLVQRCLAKDPEARWQSARDVMLELTWMARAAPSADVQREGLARHWLRGRMGWAVAGLFAVVAIALAAVLIWQSNRVNQTLAQSTPLGPVTFTVAAPENGALSPSIYFMALSSDGRRLAFVASAPGGPPFLWIRLLGSAAAQPLPGTERALAPFWSPDGRSVAFVADGKLKRVDIESKTVMVIAADAASFPGAWSHEGTILFFTGANRFEGNISRVSAQGGPVTPATTLDPTKKEVAHSVPQFLPDGRRFLFVAWGTDSALVLASLDSMTPIRRMPVDFFDTRYVEPGFLLWRQGSTMLAQKFDVSTFERNGSPTVVTKLVRYHMAMDTGVYSASSTGVLAYREVPATRLTWFDRRGTRVGLVGQSGAYSDPVLSPDGKKLAVCQFDPDAGTRDIWLCDVERCLLSRLAFNPADDVRPVWSSDSRRILFASNRRNRFFDLFVRSIDQGAQDELIEGTPPHKWPIDWTPDGRVLYRQAMAGTMSILPPGGMPTQAPPAIANVAPGDRLSPDGRWLAFSANSSSGAPDIHVAPFPTGDRTWRISSGGGIQPKWRRDGKELYYLAADGWLMAVPIDTARGFHAGPPHPLFQTALPFPVANSPESRKVYDVTPDGKRFLLNQPVGDTPITIIVNWTAKLR